MIAQHSSVSNEHYTPKYIVEAARECMGGIDLDPASCDKAQQWIQTHNYFTKQDDGLNQKWYGRVFLNPPGGKIGNKSSQKVWWQRLVDEYYTGLVNEAIFVAFNIELLQTTQILNPLYYAILNPLYYAARYTFCIPKKRIAFLDENHQSQEQPTHSNVIVYLGNSDSSFSDCFSDIGIVITGE